jgi:hypothetical protein
MGRKLTRIEISPGRRSIAAAGGIGATPCLAGSCSRREGSAGRLLFLVAAFALNSLRTPPPWRKISPMYDSVKKTVAKRAAPAKKRA